MIGRKAKSAPDQKFKKDLGERENLDIDFDKEIVKISKSFVESIKKVPIGSLKRLRKLKSLPP